MVNDKSSVAEIRERFDREINCYTNLETGQVGAVDSAFCMNLVAEAAAATTPQAQDVLDVGCGGGNYTLKLLQKLALLNVTLVDFSRRMLDRATERVRPQTSGTLVAIESDIRELELGRERFDIIFASAVLHHLRTDGEWRAVFQKLHDALKPGGSFWIFDIVESQVPEIQALLWSRYGDYLTSVKDEAYRDQMQERILREDTPRSVVFQIDLLREVGFRAVEVLHQHACFAAFGAMK